MAGTVLICGGVYGETVELITLVFCFTGRWQLFICFFLYGSCGSRNSCGFKHCLAVFTGNSDRQCWSCLALESMGANPTFRCHFLNICPSYKQSARKSLV